MAGYHCIEGSSTKTPSDGTTGVPCPRGQYCVEGTPSPENCPPGSFGNATGLRKKDECTPCTEGMYCDNAGLKQPAGYCDPRYYCTGRSQSPKPNDTTTGGPCSPGHYCPIGSAKPLPCVVSVFCLIHCECRKMSK